MRKLAIATAVVVGLALAVFLAGPAFLERRFNTVLRQPPYPVGDAARQLHARLFVADLHADSLLWNRDLLEESSTGHVDVPRLQKGGVALQVFDAVTKVPSNQNYDGNDDRSDLIRSLAILQLWPPRTWTSLTQRALYQARKLEGLAKRSQGRLRLVRSKSELRLFLEQRRSKPDSVGAVLGIEGLHTLEGSVANLDVLRAAGFHILGLAHFFDNELGGSAHGIAKGGLTEFGRQVVQRIASEQLIIDLAHASPKMIDEVLGMTTKPVLVSHTGLKGTCEHIRNLSDEHVRRIAASGGLIGIGYWDAALCDVSVGGIVRAIQYAVKLVGADHVALGSDFDGATATPFDTGGLPEITEGLVGAGFSEEDIAKIMGGNVLRLLRETLPEI